MAALAGAANVVGIVSGIAGIGFSIGGLFGQPDYTKFFEQIIDLLGQIVQQQQQMINLLTYLVALTLASIANTAVYANLEHLQSSIDYYGLLGKANLLSDNTAGGLTVNFRNEIINFEGLPSDLAVLHHNLIGDNLDLSSSLVLAYRELAKKNAFVNSSIATVNVQAMYYFTSLVQAEYAGYAQLIWASQSVNQWPASAITQAYDKTMRDRIQAQVVKFNSYASTYYSNSGPIVGGMPPMAPSDGYNQASLQSFSAYNRAFFMGVKDAAYGTLKTYQLIIPNPSVGEQSPTLFTQNDLTLPSANSASIQTIKTCVCRHPTNADTGDNVYMIYVGSDGTLHTYNWEGNWHELSSQSMTTLVPGWTSSTAYSLTTIKLACNSNGDGKAYMIALGTNLILSKYDTAQNKWVQVVSYGINQYYYGDAIAYTNIRLIVFKNVVYITRWDDDGVKLAYLSPSNTIVEPSGGLLLNKNDWNNEAYYSTMEPVISNGELYFSARAPANQGNIVRVWRFSIGTSVTVTELSRSPSLSWTSNTVYTNTPNYYNNLRLYYANDLAYLSGWNSTKQSTSLGDRYGWVTCALQPTGWNCDQSANTLVPDYSVYTTSVTQSNFLTYVTQYYVRNGSIPIVFQTEPALPGVALGFMNPTCMLTNRDKTPIGGGGGQ